ncbi:protein of unknown function [Cohaesibacter sp. ES.047]|uniref:DUF4401 domain-containing protein n=1 Tax=Cohaesibacter sp. ES.047 TaxID=1798205 RepID=UPI000BB7C670|nr:DUF4401 domain-containing protein [Cohaesibacter sp. ES.047]SNY92010.1 protein of unknown function [Cohaesibacter sp. ES.047]
MTDTPIKKEPTATKKHAPLIEEGYRWMLEAPKVPQWLDHVRKDFSLTAEDAAAIKTEILAIEDRAHAEAPLYLRALSGIGAIVSGLLFLYLLYLFGLFKLNDASLIGNGLLLMLVAMGLYRSGIKKLGLAQDFMVQTALTLLQAGKVALISGLVQMTDTLFNLSWTWPVAAILGLVAILSFLLFPSSLERFVAGITFLMSFWICLLIDGPEGGRAFAFTALVAAHLLALAAFLAYPWVRKALTSLFDALIVSLCAGVGIVSTFVKMHGLKQVDLDVVDLSIDMSGFAQKWPIQILLTLALFALIRWIAGRQTAWRSEPILIAFAGVVLLGLVADPAILLALALMIAGYATHRPVHSLLGLLLALGFGCYYYYALDITLLQKSVVLILSGIVFLFGAAIVYAKGWHLSAVKNPTVTGPLSNGDADHA